MSAPSNSRGLLREARLSLRALQSNVQNLCDIYSHDEIVVDLRADAYGHGIDELAPRLVSLGIKKARLSPGVEAPSGMQAFEGPAQKNELDVYGFEHSPVLSLLGEVVAVKRVGPGEGVSYGYTYRTKSSTNLALVGLGYADGVPRLGSNLAHATIGSTRAIIAGRIAMDQFVLDVGEAPVEVGAEVSVWSSSDDYREWATITVRTPADLTTGIAERVRRVWNNE